MTKLNTNFEREMKMVKTKITENDLGVNIELKDGKMGTVRICTRNHGKLNDGFIEVFGYKETSSGRSMSQSYCLKNLSHKNLLSIKEAVDKMITYNITHNLIE